MKKLLLSIVALLFTLGAFAQDKIYKTNGDLMEAKVIEVNPRTITYKRADNPDGPTYIINRSEVSRIVYENGQTEEISGGSRMPGAPRRSGRPTEKLGNNILALAPVQITNEGIGVGLSYERILGKNGILSFYLPLALVFNPNNNNYYTGSPYVNYNTTMFYAMPGVKFYPTGQGKVRYAVGPSILIGVGEKNVYDNVQGFTYPQDYVTAGILINNSLNITPTPHLYLGLELGLGLSYYNTINGDNVGIGGIDGAPLVQFGFRMGYRF